MHFYIWGSGEETKAHFSFIDWPDVGCVTEDQIKKKKKMVG